MSEGTPFPDAFASAAGAQTMRDVLSRRCAEQAVEIAALRKECARLRERLAALLVEHDGDQRAKRLYAP